MIPLVRSNSVEDINTSLIATRREIENGGSGSGSSMSNGNMNVNVNVIYDIIDEVKAGSGLPVTSNAVADALSYSTTEIKTGGKWIDGKPIYRKVLPFTNPQNLNGDTTISISSFTQPIDFTTISNVTFCCLYRNSPIVYGACGLFNITSTSISISIWGTWSNTNGIVIEYTKTTD